MVTWSDHAKADLRHIHDFIAADSRHYAKQVTRVIVEKTQRLSELPRIGKVVPEINDETIRELHLYSFQTRISTHEHPRGAAATVNHCHLPTRPDRLS